MSALSKECIKMFGIEKMYKKCKVVFNSKAKKYFYAMLFEYGVREVFKYNVKTSFDKDYGYFFVAK